MNLDHPFDEIERLREEVARLKRGDFTPEEFQNLCHHRDETPGCTAADFRSGCTDYQRKLFGSLPHLFMTGDFTLRSGAKSKWKIECDALTPADWDGLARMAMEILPPFHWVEGVPRGGLPFAAALRRYCTPLSLTIPPTVLIAEDVVTTGGSMERFRESLVIHHAKYIGVAAFARGPCPDWVIPVLRMTNEILVPRLE